MIRSLRLVGLLLGAFVAIAASTGFARADSPFGVMLFPNPGEDFDLTLARARGLGVGWFRPPTIALQSGSIGTPSVFTRSGLKLAITVRNSADPSARSPAQPPADVMAYRKSIAAVLAAWKPSLLVVENEEDSPTFYAGGADAYAAELSTACAVAHAAHTLCANGGLSGKAAASLTWLGFLTKGQADRACDFAQRALKGEKLCTYHKTADVPTNLRARLAGSAEALVQRYKTVPIDMVNFHWFGGDSRAFAEIAEYLSTVTGKPAITNEFGQRRGADDPNNVRPLLRAAIAEKIPLAIWYSVDTTGTVSLFGPDGRLRPTGWEFQRQLSGLR
ncbi:MAG TPA: hypothetical protein VGG27_14695 [Magnetospirillaceae bacterium]